MSDSDLLAVQLFIGSLAAGVLFLVITQAGLTQRWLVRGMLILAGALAVSAIFWRHIAPLVSPLDELLESIVGNRLIWFLIGAGVGALVLSLANRSWRRSPFRICLERDSGSDQYGVQNFPSITYIQIAVKVSKRVTNCRAWFTQSQYSADKIVPFSIEHNERHQLRWSKAGGSDPFEIDLRPSDPSIRVNVAVATMGHLQFEPDPTVGTPSNLFAKLQRIGFHRLQIGIVGYASGKEVYSNLNLNIHWLGPDRGVGSVQFEPL